VFSDTGNTPNGVGFMLTQNGRLFIMTTPAGGASQIMLYNFNLTTGATSYVGRIQVPVANVAATTHTVRGFKVYDNGTTGWKIFVETTGSVAVNGGLYMANNIDLADFVPIGFPIIPFATGNNQKAMYFLQDPANIGAGQLQTSSAGLIMDYVAQRVYAHNGTAATHQYYVYDFSVAPTSPSNTVTITIATPGVVSDAGHAYNANDQVVLSTTGSLPTGLVAGTVYFVRNPVAGVSYELSATSGGASINTTGAQSGVHTARRAFGQTGALFLHKTGNLPALTGTLLLTNSEYFAQPTHVLSGFDCAAFATTTNLYLAKLSELTNGATTWPSLSTANILGTGSDIIAPTTIQSVFSSTLDNFIYLTGSASFVVKQLVNNVIVSRFGCTTNDNYEGVSLPNGIQFGFNVSAGLDTRQGWLLASSITVGQRGIAVADLRSSSIFDYSNVITKVLDTSNGQYKNLTSWQQLLGTADGYILSYRSAATASDPIFNTASGGWTSISVGEDVSAVSTQAFSQFKIQFLFTSRANYRQLQELFIQFLSNFEQSDYWEYAGSISSNGVPVRVAWRLRKLYSSSVPTLFYRAYDLTGAGPLTPGVQNTVTHAANFEYSTDGGNTWLPLGTIPNTVGTLMRYNYSTPPGVQFRPSVRES
jgi:hypothetical protein